MSRKIFQARVEAHMPQAMADLIREAATSRAYTASEYVRDLLADGLRRDGYSPPIVARRIVDRRLEEILALPEAAGRRPMAARLARTKIDIDRVRELLRAAPSLQGA
jgi:hypothetical protein